MKNYKNYKNYLVAMLTSILLLITAPINKSETPPDFTIIPPSDAAAATGRTYGEWSAAWWQYALEIPLQDNPLFDPTGENCNFAQSGEVFFLVATAGGDAVRNECHVPAGKVLFFPILTSSYSPEPGDREPEHAMRNYLAAIPNGARELLVTIDGVDIRTIVNLNPHRTPFRAVSPSGFFAVVPPENNISGWIPGDTHYLIADGFYMMIAPLAPGPHTISFGGVTRNFSSHVTYNLVVGEQN